MKYDAANIGLIYETCKRLHDYFMIELNYYVFMNILLYCHIIITSSRHIIIVYDLMMIVISTIF